MNLPDESGRSEKEPEWRRISPDLQDFYKKRLSQATSSSVKNDLEPGFFGRGDGGVVSNNDIPDGRIPMVEPLGQINKSNHRDIQQKTKLQPLTSLGDGARYFWERMKNDMNYNIGAVQSAVTNEQNRRAAQAEALKNRSVYDNMSDTELGDLIERTQNEVLDAAVEQRRKDPYRFLGNPGRFSLPEVKDTEEMLEKRRRLAAMREIQEMRSKGMDNESIARSFEDFSRYGGAGTKRMEESLKKNDMFPPTQGMAKIGEFGAMLAKESLPIAAAIAYPPAGVALGAGNVLSSAAQSHAQAQMNVDRYEKTTGEKLTPEQRTNYVAAFSGADLLLGSLMQSRLLGNVTGALKNGLAEKLRKSLLNNKAAQGEMNKLLGRVIDNEKDAILKGMSQDAIWGGLTDGTVSAVQDISSAIYASPEEYPSLAQIMDNAIAASGQGMVSGGLVGGMGRSAVRHMQNRRRKKAGDIYIAEDPDMEHVEVLGIKPEEGLVQVLSPEGKIVESGNIPVESISRSSFAELEKIKEERAKMREERKKLWEPEPPDSENNQRWKRMTVDEKAAVAQDMIDKMGLNINVYRSDAEVPNYVKKRRSGSVPLGYFTSEIDDSGVVVSKIPSYSRLQEVIRHEAIGHRGVEILLGSEKKKNAFFDQVYEEILPFDKKFGTFYDEKEQRRVTREFIAEMAEKGTDTKYWNRIVSKLKQFVPGLKMSENDLRYMLWKSQKLYTNEIPTLNEMQKLLYYDIKTSKNEKLRDLLFREGIDSPRYIETEDE